MCKVLIMTGITNSENALAFMKAAQVPMSRMDRDGIGYAAVKSDGSIFSEKWHNNSNFMNTEDVMDAATREALQPYSNKLPLGALNLNYSKYGDVNYSDMRTVMMHTRMATCGKEFANTHPFIVDDNVLIHNGVIRNQHFLSRLNKVSTCDSEVALNAYLENGVNLKPEIAQEWLDMLTGYWAFGLLSKDSNGNRILDVVREGATLYFTKVNELGDNSLVFATTKEILEDAAKSCGFTLSSSPFLYKESNLHRFDAVSGELIDNYILDTAANNKSFNSWSHYGHGNSGSNHWGSSFRSEREYDEWDYWGEHSIQKSNAPVASKPVEKTEDDLLTTEEYDSIMELCNNKQDCLLDRLEVFDSVSGTDYVSDYESLFESEKANVKRIDSMLTMTFDDVLDAIDLMTERDKQLSWKLKG